MMFSWKLVLFQVNHSNELTDGKTATLTSLEILSEE